MPHRPPPHHWDPARYLQFGDERGRPFLDLLARVGASSPREVADLGCGPGTLTRLLAQRWPDAALHAVDSSPTMVAQAREHLAGIADVVQADLRDWRPPARLDVLVTNATLQWVPGHLELLPSLLASVSGDGWFAMQLPGNHDEPSHALRRELAAREPYAVHTEGVAEPHSHQPEDYLAVLLEAGFTADVWETTYLHVLQGEDPVLRWVIGTGARPTLQALPDHLRRRFEAELGAALRDAYPATPHGTVHPFRRVFAVGQRTS